MTCTSIVCLQSVYDPLSVSQLDRVHQADQTTLSQQQNQDTIGAPGLQSTGTISTAISNPFSDIATAASISNERLRE